MSWPEDYRHERKIPARFGRGVAPPRFLGHPLPRLHLRRSRLHTRSELHHPTGQNLANIEKDMEALVPKVLSKPQDEIRHAFEMLVRAYDRASRAPRTSSMFASSRVTAAPDACGDGGPGVSPRERRPMLAPGG